MAIHKEDKLAPDDIAASRSFETRAAGGVYRSALRFLFLNQETNQHYVPQQAEGEGIPRIIHQTHRSMDELPSSVRDSIAALRKRNPAWEYRFYDDRAVTDFIGAEYGDRVLGYYQRIDDRYSAARADLFRYLLMYRVGGVYLDIKSTIKPALDDLIMPGDRMLLSQWSQTGRFFGAGLHDWDFAGKISGGELQQWHVICADGHSYLYAVINAIMRNIECYVPAMHGTGRNAVLRVTGPIAYTLAVLPLLHRRLHRFVGGHEEAGLQYSVYDDNTHHKRLFKSHYTDLTEPVVLPTLRSRTLSAIYCAADTVRHWRFGR